MSDILNEMSNQFVLFPIKYNTIWNMYKKAVSAFWTAEEIDLSKDLSDWEKLNTNEQFFIKNILAFFAGSDGIVNENLSVRFMNDVKIQEAKCFYGFQIAMENIHCVAPNTQVMTDEGYFCIYTLENKYVNVWNGTEFSSVMVMKTSESADAYEVSLSNGMCLICTSNHEWLIKDNEQRIKTIDLTEGMQIIQYEYPVIDKVDDYLFNDVCTHGLISFQNLRNSRINYNPLKYNCRPQHFVPINYSVSTKIEWLKGAFQNVIIINKICKFENDNVLFLKDVQLMLTTLGIFSSVDAEKQQLLITFKMVKKLLNLGLILDSYILMYLEKEEEKEEEGEGEGQFDNISIISIKKLDIQLPMYCFEEHKNHTGVFNGILTGQSETYSLLLDTYIKDEKEKSQLLNAIDTIPCIKLKAEWAMKWITNKDVSFTTRLVAFACVEGIFFSGAFCAIFWLKERGVLPGLCLSNEFISRDESLHTEFAIHLYSLLTEHRLEESVIYDIVKEAVSIEDEFINHSIPCDMLGMNKSLMSQYIKFVADRLISQLGYNTVYNVTNPFQFMERIGLNNKSNFFEHTRISDYSKAWIGKENDEMKFSLDADF